MINRRFVLFSGCALAGLAWADPALARHAHAKKASPDGGKAVGKTADAAASDGPPAQTPLGPYDTVAKWAIAIDFDTNAVLLSKDADTQMPPSSMTKLMTAYIVYGMLDAGRLKLDQMLPVSEKAWRMQGSKMFVPIGQQVKVEDLIRGMIIQSGNDACIVLAEGIAGSEEQFVQLMNDKAKQLGLTNSHFENCTGWPAEGHYMSCRDIATLARDLIKTFPEYYKYDSERSFVYNGISQENRNILVQKGVADGLKTGHTEAGGFGEAASAERNGQRRIVVLNGMNSMHQRAEESERVLDWAFREFENAKLFAAKQPVDHVPVYLGVQPTVAIGSKDDVIVTMPRGWERSAKVMVHYDAPVAAPVAPGAKLGTASFTGKGVPAMEVPLYALNDVPRLPLLRRAVAVLEHKITGS